jgi:kynurenine 3-monooxygenase
VSTDVGIAGAGLAGSLLAVYLARRGHRVTVYERRPDPRNAGSEGGRSINLALSVRGIAALAGVGLDGPVLERALPMRGRMLHAVDGGLAFQAYSADGTKAINSVSRAGLNAVLLDAVDEHGVSTEFACRVVGVDPDTGRVDLDAPSGARQACHEVVLGADGAFSAARSAIVRNERVDYRQDYLPWGYKELAMPPTASGDFALDPGALHIWPRRTSMMIALPNPDHTFTCTLFWPFEGPDGFADLDRPGAVRARFDERYGDVVPLVPDLVDQFAANPVGSLATIRVWPWVRGRVALLGDAAHAIVPFYGQGMNCAFEDVVELDRCLAETGDAFGPALERFAARRKPNADAIADLALDNFVEMRDKVASPLFRLGKRAEHALELAIPGRVESLYELVSFSQVPYAEARIRARRQRAAIRLAAGGLAAGGLALAGLVGAGLAGRRST